MTHALILEIPEEVYDPLLKKATQIGQTPEELAVQWLVTVAQQLVDDPLEKFIGIFNSDIPDWADEHDRYIGQTGLIEAGEQGYSQD
jgi:hypothetical protein